MAYNFRENLDKLTCTDYVDFGKCQDRFGRYSWSKIDSNYLDNKLKVFKRQDKNAEFRLRQNFSMGEADFNQFIRQKNQLVVAADNLLREQNLSSVLQYTLSKDMEEQLKLVPKVIDVVGLPKQKGLCDTAAKQVGQPRHLLCSSSSIRTEEGGTKIFSKLCMLTINLTNLFIFLTS